MCSLHTKGNRLLPCVVLFFITFSVNTELFGELETISKHKFSYYRYDWFCLMKLFSEPLWIHNKLHDDLKFFANTDTVYLKLKAFSREENKEWYYKCVFNLLFMSCFFSLNSFIFLFLSFFKNNNYLTSYNHSLNAFWGEKLIKIET